MMGQPNLPTGTEPKKRQSELGRAFKDYKVTSWERSPSAFIREMANDLMQRAAAIDALINEDEISEEPKEESRRIAELKIIAKDAKCMRLASKHMDKAWQHLSKCSGASVNRIDYRDG